MLSAGKHLQDRPYSDPDRPRIKLADRSRDHLQLLTPTANQCHHPHDQIRTARNRDGPWIKLRAQPACQFVPIPVLQLKTEPGPITAVSRIRHRLRA